MLPHIPQKFEFIHIKSVKDLPHLLIVIFLILGIGLGVYLAMRPQIFINRAQESSLIDLKFIPEYLQVQTGKTYEAKIGINPKGERVTAAQLNIRYDPLAVRVEEVKNGGFLPIDLKIKDDFDGNLTLVYGATIETQAILPGMLTTIKFKVINPYTSSFEIKTDSEVSVSSKEGNVLDHFSKMIIEPMESTAPGEIKEYPDNLLLEKAFFASSEPAIRDFKEILEPKPEFKPGRVKPAFSEAFILQLGKDIFISPIVALNEVLQEKAADVLGK